MLVKNRTITETDVLEVIAERKNEETISFEEVYYDVLNYNPSI